MSQIAIRYVFGVVLLAMASVLGHAQQQADGPENRGTGTSILILPEGNETPVSRPANGATAMVYIKNGVTGFVDWIEICLKDIDDDTNKRATKLTVVSATAATGSQNLIVETAPNPPIAKAGRLTNNETEGKCVKFSLSQALAENDILRIRIKVEARDDPADYVDAGNDGFGSKEGEQVLFNIKMVNSNHEPIEPNKLGENAKLHFSDAFDTADVSPDPIERTAQQTPGIVAAPDLVYAEVSQARIVPGILTFNILAEAEFVDGGALVATAIDRDGHSVLDPSRVEIGMVGVINGHVVVDVLHRDPADEDPVAIVVRGVEVDLPALGANQTIGYSVGGTATRGFASRAARLVTTGEFDQYVTLSSAVANVEFQMGDQGSFHIGGGTSVVAAPDATDVVGYVSAIVLEELGSECFRPGSIVYRPQGNFAFIPDSATKVYVLDATSDEDASTAFGTVSLSLVDGAYVVTLGNRVDTSMPLKVVLANIKIDMGVGQFAWGQNAIVAIGGTGLPSAVAEPAVLVEGVPLPMESDPRMLRQVPLGIQDWTPVASVQ